MCCHDERYSGDGLSHDDPSVRFAGHPPMTGNSYHPPNEPRIKGTLRTIWSQLPPRIQVVTFEAWSLLVDGPPLEFPGRAFLFINRILWSKVEGWRALLTMEPAELSTRQRRALGMLQALMKMPDGLYRRRLARLGRQLSKARSEGLQQRSLQRSGVLMMIGSLGPGGAERQLVATAKGLRESGETNITVACVNLAAPSQRFFLPDLEASGIATAVVGSGGGSHTDPHLAAMVGRLPRELWEIADFAQTITAQSPAIAHLWLDDINVKGGIAAVLAGVPRIILSQRSLPPTVFAFHQPYMREGYRWLAEAPGVTMINNSAAGARAYEAWLGLPRGRIGVVHNGFDFDENELALHRAGRASFRERFGVVPDVPLIGAVMRISEEKRPLLWLAIAAGIRVMLPEAKFLIVGDGPMRSQAEARAKQPDLAGSVHFTGHSKEAMTAIAAMDLLLLTSRVEGLPNVLVEAQFLGVPVVSTKVGGAIEAIDLGRSGICLEGTDPHEFARQIVRLLQDTPWLRTAGRFGAAFARTNFDMQRAVDETLAAYGGAKVKASD